MIREDGLFQSLIPFLSLSEEILCSFLLVCCCSSMSSSTSIETLLSCFEGLAQSSKDPPEKKIYRVAGDRQWTPAKALVKLFTTLFLTFVSEAKQLQSYDDRPKKKPEYVAVMTLLDL